MSSNCIMNNQTSFGILPFSVMLNEFKISSPIWVQIIDCTFGGGAIQRNFKFPNTTVKALDRDEKTLVIAKDLESKFPKDLNFFEINLAK